MVEVTSVNSLKKYLKFDLLSVPTPWIVTRKYIVEKANLTNERVRRRERKKMKCKGRKMSPEERRQSQKSEILENTAGRAP